MLLENKRRNKFLKFQLLNLPMNKSPFIILYTLSD